MQRQRLLALVGLLGLAALLSACREEQPVGAPPATSSRLPADAGKATERAGRISPEMQKQSRVDACAYGTLGLFDVREAYLESLGGKEPAPGRIPAFGPTAGLVGERREPQPRGGVRPLHHVSPTGEISLAKAVRSCTVASRLTLPPVPELDTELGRYEPFVTSLFARLSDAARYYRDGGHEKDGCAHGQRLHAELMKDFALLDERSNALRMAVERWRANAPPAPDPLEPDGRAGERAVRAARRVTNLLVERAVPDAGTVEGAAEELEQATVALTELGKRAPRSPFVRLVLPPLAELGVALDAARASRKAEAAVPPRAARKAALYYAAVADEWSRAVARVIGARAHGDRASIDRARPPIRSANPPPRPAPRPPTSAPAVPSGDGRP
jgi:hypothetical protein